MASKELRCKNLLIVMWDYDGSIVTEGKKIALVPLWKWLPNKEL
jgi:predicted AAA+ superfamily ATPase